MSIPTDDSDRSIFLRLRNSCLLHSLFNTHYVVRKCLDRAIIVFCMTEQSQHEIHGRFATEQWVDYIEDIKRIVLRCNGFQPNTACSASWNPISKSKFTPARHPNFTPCKKASSSPVGYGVVSCRTCSLPPIICIHSAAYTLHHLGCRTIRRHCLLELAISEDSTRWPGISGPGPHG